MALAQVQKIQLLVSSDIKSELLSSLQQEGLVQIEAVDHTELGLAAPLPEASELDHDLFILNHSIDYLSRWDKRKFGEKLFGEKPQISREKKEEILGFEYKTVLEEISQLEEKEKNWDSQIRFLQKELEFLVPLRDLDLPIREVKATDSTKILIGFLPSSQFEEFQQRSEEEAIWHKIIQKTKRQAYIIVIYNVSHEDLVLQMLGEVNFNPVYFTESIIDEADDGDRVKDVEQRILHRIEENQAMLSNIDEEGQRLFAHRENLMCVYDVLQNERGKLLTSNLLGETEQVFYLEGWIRSADIKEFQSKLSVYSDWIEYHFRPPHPDEEPPAILKNPKVSRPFELITKLYGLPQRRSIDPTLALAPFFFLFVGLTVSEAGYGLLVTLLSLLYLKFGKPKGGLRQFLQLLSILGISTVILGTLVGGWFGFPVRKLMILDPLEDPLSFLILSLVLGFIQVWFGTLLSMISRIRNKEYLQAIFVQGGWLILLPFLVLYGLTKQSLWGIIALSGAAGIVFFAAPSRNPLARFFGGLYSLYDISRYLADILSYSRLLALGLATSVIAMVVNTLCQTALGIPWVGWLLAALIFVGGHLFNLGISFLGGFVHSMRLQFVEFFSKFYLSGGRPFQPFELESKYVDFI